ncbi:MAG: hypothetical protein C5B59_17490 [Bacteroidetes bacterium]|nr:MAG: hypothetical protein C5B59_17490 [Bacteroidota bacterium]
MSQENKYNLIDHLDRLLEGEELAQVENLILNDQEAARDWQILQIAVEAIQEAGLNDRVAAIGKEYKIEKQAKQHNGSAVVRQMNISRYILRVAAAVLILVGIASVYKYTTVNASSLFGQYYSSYELNTSRGAVKPAEIEQAYRNKDWNKVIILFNASSEKNNQAYFLTGMASLETRNYQQAIEDFDHIMKENAKTGDSLFQDEAEYYMAMSLLANNQVAQAISLLNKIKADKNHQYNQKVKEISAVDYQIMEWKSGK